MNVFRFSCPSTIPLVELRRYVSDDSVTAVEGFPLRFMDITADPDTLCDLMDYMATCGYSYVETDPTTTLKEAFLATL